MPTKRKNPRNGSDTPDRERLLELGTSSLETEPKPDGKRGRGRPPKPRITLEEPAPVARAESPVLPRPLVRDLIKAPYNLAARFYGKKWALSDEEAEGMIDAHLQLAELYLPSWIDKNPVLYTVAFMHLIAIAGRTGLSEKLLELTGKPREEKPPDTHKADEGLPPVAPIAWPSSPSRFGALIEDPPGSHPTPGLSP